MISSIKILFISLTIIICFGVPIGLTLFICIKKKASIKAVLIGILIFFLFQIITRIPILNILSNADWYKNLNIICISLILGFTAGLFEEIGRFIGFKYMIKGKRDWNTGIAYGIGHGGIEAILLVGIGYLKNLIYSFMINSGTFIKLIAPQLAVGQAQLIKSTLINTQSYMFIFSGLERLLVITIHIALSLIVLYGIKIPKKSFLFLAILIHTLLDTPAVLMSYNNVNFFIIESYIAIFAIISLVFIIKSRKLFASN